MPGEDGAACMGLPTRSVPWLVSIAEVGLVSYQTVMIYNFLAVNWPEIFVC